MEHFLGLDILKLSKKLSPEYTGIFLLFLFVLGTFYKHWIWASDIITIKQMKISKRFNLNFLKKKACIACQLPDVAKCLISFVWLHQSVGINEFDNFLTCNKKVWSEKCITIFEPRAGWVFPYIYYSFYFCLQKYKTGFIYFHNFSRIHLILKNIGDLCNLFKKLWPI